MVTNKQLAVTYETNALKVGVKMEPERNDTVTSGGSTDMGNVSHVVPSIHTYFYIGSSSPIHTRTMAQAAGKYSKFYYNHLFKTVNN